MKDVIIVPADPRYPIEKRPLITSSMKAECMGEFTFSVPDSCGECLDVGADEDCPVCEGQIEYQREVTVPWDTCKQIYKRMAMAAAKEPTE